MFILSISFVGISFLLSIFTLSNLFSHCSLITKLEKNHQLMIIYLQWSCLFQGTFIVDTNTDLGMNEEKGNDSKKGVDSRTFFFNI